MLERDDRNFLMKHKSYEMLKAEDPENKQIWDYDEKGNKVLLRGEDGELVDLEEATTLHPEEEVDPMQGLKNLTK